MFDENDKDIEREFAALGIPYKWKQLNIDLKPELHKRDFHLVTHFYYQKGQAECILPVILFHVKRNFEVLLKLIQLKKLNINVYYVKLFSEDNPVVISDVMEDLSPDHCAEDMQDVLTFASSRIDKNRSPFIFSTKEHRRWITEIQFTFYLEEDFFA